MVFDDTKSWSKIVHLFEDFPHFLISDQSWT